MLLVLGQSAVSLIILSCASESREVRCGLGGEQAGTVRLEGMQGWLAESCAAAAEEDGGGLGAAERGVGQQEMCLGQCLQCRVMCLIWNDHQCTFQVNSVCPYPKSSSMQFLFSLAKEMRCS